MTIIREFNVKNNDESYSTKKEEIEINSLEELQKILQKGTGLHLIDSWDSGLINLEERFFRD